MYNPFELTLIIYKNSFAWNIFLAILKGFLYFCKIMDVSVIIVNYNTLHVLRPCLDSIIEQTTGIDYEIIVVDNGSTDGSIEALSNDDRITLIATGENLGFGKANNKGLLYARGEYIFFLNSDTLLMNNAIKQLYDFATHYQGKLGALGCVLEDRKGNKIHSYGSFPKMRDDLQKYIVIPLLKGFRLYRQPATLYPDEWMKVDYVTGADLLSVVWCSKNVEPSIPPSSCIVRSQRWNTVSGRTDMIMSCLTVLGLFTWKEKAARQEILQNSLETH